MGVSVRLDVSGTAPDVAAFVLAATNGKAMFSFGRILGPIEEPRERYRHWGCMDDIADAVVATGRSRSATYTFSTESTPLLGLCRIAAKFPHLGFKVVMSSSNPYFEGVFAWGDGVLTHGECTTKKVDAGRWEFAY